MLKNTSLNKVLNYVLYCAQNTLARILSTCCLILVSGFLMIVFSQEKVSLHFQYGAEILGDNITASKSLGFLLRYNLSSSWYVSSYFRMANGNNFNGKNGLTIPTNFIRLGEIYPFESHSQFDDLNPGLGILRPTDGNILLLANGYLFGRQGYFTEHFRWHVGIGVTLSYIDLQTISAEGSGFFEYDGKEDLLWFTVPAYARGFSTHISGQLGLEIALRHLRVGIQATPEVSMVNIAAGNRYPISFSIGIPLSSYEDEGSHLNYSDLSLSFSTGWVHHGHSSLNGFCIGASVALPITSMLWNVELGASMAYSSGSRRFRIIPGKKYNIGDAHDPSLGFDGFSNGVPKKSWFLKSFPIRPDRTFEFDLVPAIRYHVPLRKESLSISLGGVIAVIHKMYIADVREGDLFLSSGQLYGEDIMFISPHSAYYLDVGATVSARFGVLNKENASLGIFGGGTYLSQGQVNYSIGLYGHFW